MEAWMAWTVLIVGFLLPMFHVSVSSRSGPWLPPPGARCPLGPRIGWLVMVILLGPIGWLMFMRGTAVAKRAAAKARQSETEASAS